MKEIDFTKITFEEALAQLENIVRELECGKIKLDDAVEAYEKATALKTFCEEKLQAAQLKIVKITTHPSTLWDFCLTVVFIVILNIFTLFLNLPNEKV